MFCKLKIFPLQSLLKMIVESKSVGQLVSALVVGRFNKTHLELDLKINRTSGVTNCYENCNNLQWVDLLQIATKSYYKLRQLIYYELEKFIRLR